MNDEIIKKIIHIFIIIFITILVGTIIALLILKYNVEGENNMPFKLSKIMIISTAQGEEINEDTENQSKWNLEISQNNDVYLEISKNKNYKETEIIDEIIIDNLVVNEEPKKGDVVIYKPTSKEEKIYENNDENKVENSLIYKGSEESSIKKLEIANQGGIILFRYSIRNLGKYISDEDEVKHDGTILSKIGIEYEEIKCKVSFDLSIKLKSDVIYTGNVSLDLPVGNIVEEGTAHKEMVNLENITFKRNLR